MTSWMDLHRIPVYTSHILPRSRSLRPPSTALYMHTQRMQHMQHVQRMQRLQRMQRMQHMQHMDMDMVHAFAQVRIGVDANDPDDVAGLSSSCARLHKLLDAEVAGGTPSTDIVLGGFSQVIAADCR